MLSTVTPATIADVMSRAGIPEAAQVVSLVAAVIFLLLLIEKELVGNGASPQARALSRSLNIGLLPLGIVVTLIVAAAVIHSG